jgi:DNA-binding NarL/FixJ family response regulator
MANTIKIILAEDHEFLRDGFSSFIEKCPGIKLVAEACNGKQLVQLTEKWRPDVVLTDIKMPVMNGIEATREISKKFPDVGVIAFSMFNDEYLLNEMLEAGATGYLVKNASKEEIIAAIIAVSNQKSFFCSDTKIKLANLKAANNENQLTEKEKELIFFICCSMENKEIADKLFLSVRTIEGYREKIMEKIKAKKVLQLFVYAIVNKIIHVKPNQEVHRFNPLKN